MREAYVLATKHLRSRDPVMRALIKEVGPCTLRCQRNRFWMLVRSIISQQVSVAAARSILARVEALVDEKTPEAFARLTHAQLRGAGVSPQKVGYLEDLCHASLGGRVRLERIGRKPDEEVIEELIQIKGIGRWTAQMFLIFSLGRLDVFPVADLGVRSALRNLYELDDLPDVATSLELSAPWRPYATIGSWYCWRSLERKADPTREASK